MCLFLFFQDKSNSTGKSSLPKGSFSGKADVSVLIPKTSASVEQAQQGEEATA